jgi:hypothetical protein
VQESHPAAVLYGDGTGRISGAVTVNWPRALIECRRHVASKTPVTTVAARITELATPAPRTAGAPT